jgi:hypothetical protein
MRVKEVGPHQWKKDSGYHQQARVENTFFRYKTIIGDRQRMKIAREGRADATWPIHAPTPRMADVSPTG